jgi:hypothetical protein
MEMNMKASGIIARKTVRELKNMKTVMSTKVLLKMAILMAMVSILGRMAATIKVSLRKA